MDFKTDWKTGDIVKPDDVNRMEENTKLLSEQKADKIKPKTLTLTKDGWEAAAFGEFSYRKVIPLEGITSQDVVSCSIGFEHSTIAWDCHLSNTNQTSDGTITFYAERVPTEDIVMEYYVLKGA